MRVRDLKRYCGTLATPFGLADVYDTAKGFQVCDGRSTYHVKDRDLLNAFDSCTVIAWHINNTLHVAEQ